MNDLKIETEILKVKDLRTYYMKDDLFTRAVDDVSLSISKGGKIGLSGESGSGKTQMALSIMGLIDNVPGIVAGEIWIDGLNLLEDLPSYCSFQVNGKNVSVEKDVSQWKKVQESRFSSVRGKKVSMVFQEPRSSLDPFFKVDEQLREFLVSRYGNAVNEAHKDRVLWLLEHMHFANPARILKSYPHELCGGESQRIMLAFALFGNPKLLIADEPTTMLDTITQYRVLELMAEMIEEMELALLFVTHNLAILSLLVDYVLIMFSGKIVEQGSVASLLNDSKHEKHPYTEILLTSARQKEEFSERPLNEEAIQLDTQKNVFGCCYYHRCALRKKLDSKEQKRCLNEAPPLFKLSDDHLVACWAREN